MFTGIEAATIEDLREKLQAIDITVPLRTKGREGWHCERWIVCRWLATLSEHGRIGFPISLRKQERPDFVLCHGDRQEGIEITEAVVQDDAHAQSLHEREFPNAIFEPAHFQPSDGRRSVDELRSLFDRPSHGWPGDLCELWWADWMARSIANKFQKAQDPEFKRFPSNSLLIYDNLPIQMLNQTEALRHLMSKLAKQQPSAFGIFESIFIETGATILELTGTSTNRLPLNDLWRAR